jgi:myo-inositol-1-phosphate synthase
MKRDNHNSIKIELSFVDSFRLKGFIIIEIKDLRIAGSHASIVPMQKLMSYPMQNPLDKYS